MLVHRRPQPHYLSCRYAYPASPTTDRYLDTSRLLSLRACAASWAALRFPPPDFHAILSGSMQQHDRDAPATW
ncbi:hypothetical protein CHLRE_16g656466v5 [Chlamydomonas reinhardtii]|uniref:Uncharacterized protein n=1 Tax=Chlamydomonas reinhardtii TaxID=3055 RepID=A0A2K3CT97_CHLRE|nr:uncharacterized protein CHLRE_16g656466v5 [Chlamydomonas reinhardtii]PNW71491.1 hypothetical protein CHLRE_16g656466v5 [Chlamydomonas reinhardtii]